MPNKKANFRSIMTVLLLCIMMLSTCLSCTPSTDYEERTTILVYIHAVEDTGISFDQIEWVNNDSDRALELGIEPHSLPNGFYIHNEAEVVEMLPFAENCLFHILDWYGDYLPIDVSHEAFVDTLTERTAGNSVHPIPYYVTIEKGEIIDIQERYIP